jgi:hypothetical protein
VAVLVDIDVVVVRAVDDKALDVQKPLGLAVA